MHEHKCRTVKKTRLEPQIAGSLFSSSCAKSTQCMARKGRPDTVYWRPDGIEKHRGGNAELYMRANLPLYLLRKLHNTLRPSLQGRPQSSGIRMCGRMKSCKAVLVHLGWEGSRREKSTTGWAPQGIGGEDSTYVCRQYGHGRTHVGYSFCDRRTEGRIGEPYIGQTQTTVAYTPSQNALLHFVIIFSACTTIANPHGLTALPICASTNGIEPV